MFLKSHRGTIMTLMIALVMGFCMALAALVVDGLACNFSNIFKIWAMITLVVLLVSLFVPYQSWGSALPKALGCKEGTWGWKLLAGIIPSLILNTFNTVIVSMANILYNDLIPAQAQMGELLHGILHDWPIMLVISYLVSFLAEFIGKIVADRFAEEEGKAHGTSH